MPTTSFHHPPLALAITLGLSLWASPAAAQTAPNGKIPELASSTFAWLVIRPEWLPPPAGLRGPIPADPEQRQHMNQDGAGQVTVRLGNWRDPVLKPWAAEQMRLSNEEVLAGKRILNIHFNNFDTNMFGRKEFIRRSVDAAKRAEKRL